MHKLKRFNIKEKRRFVLSFCTFLSFVWENVDVVWQGPRHFHDTQSGWIQYCVINHWGNGGNQLTNCAKLQIVLVCVVAQRVLFMGQITANCVFTFDKYSYAQNWCSRTQRFVCTNSICHIMALWKQKPHAKCIFLFSASTNACPKSFNKSYLSFQMCPGRVSTA